MSQDYETIAMVDNEEDIVSLFIELLQANGYAVIGFTNPLFLIDHIHEHPDRFGLILIDYRMPQMTGCHLANQIHAINPKIKMILLTAFDDIVNNALNLEIAKKPITLNQILDLVDRNLNSLIEI
ncbi:MAG TPA: response regulator [Nitrososphaeraceae archaeon]|nr:response regulator [Nitrososphaeraceae archaeon]